MLVQLLFLTLKAVKISETFKGDISFEYLFAEKALSDGIVMNSILFENCSFKYCITVGAQQSRSLHPAKNKQKMEGAHQKIAIKFNYCIWEENKAVDKGSGGAFLQSSSLPVSFIAQIAFSFCNFIKNFAIGGNGGAISIRSAEPFCIDNCRFENNRASSLDGFGGALYIDPKIDQKNCMPNIEITKCVFIENEASDGNALYIELNSETTININEGNVFTSNGYKGCEIYCNSKNLHINDIIIFNDTISHMQNNTNNNKKKNKKKSQKSHSSPIYMSNEAKYENMVFENKYGDGSGANALDIDNSYTSVIIHKCVFKNCGSYGIVIDIRSQPISFINNTIIFTGNDRCIGLIISIAGVVNIEQCLFKNCHGADNKPGGVLYEPIVNKDGYEEIIFSDTIFDGILGEPKNCFYFILYTKDGYYFKTDNITIQYTNSAEYSGGIEFVNEVQSIALVNWKFIKNKSSSKYGGGCPILITSRSALFSIDFIDCCWDINKANANANGNGGAFQYKNAQTYYLQELTFNKSSFWNNAALKDGGALAFFGILIDCMIYDCKFIGNSGCGFGGAIYVDSNSNSNSNFYLDQKEIKPTISIKSCIFQRNYAGTNGHAIYLNGMSTYVIIDKNNVFTDNVFPDNVFADNGIIRPGSTLLSSVNAKTTIHNDVKIKEVIVEQFIIVSECQNMIFQNGTIENSKINYGGKGIKIISGKAFIENIMFKKCESGIFVAQNSLEVTINKCIFLNCSRIGNYVNHIQNAICSYTNNVINSTSVEYAGGIEITSNGIIHILFNTFFQNYGQIEQSSTIF